MAKLKNLLINTSFENYEKSWVINNGKLKRQGNTLTIKSEDKLLGVTQDFLLNKPSRLYFGVKVKIKKPIEKLIVGISNGGELKVAEYKHLMINQWQTVSVIVDVKDTTNMTQSVYLLATLLYNTGEIEIKEPVLYNLRGFYYYTLKSQLDKIPYTAGLTFGNERTTVVFSGLSFSGKYWAIANAGKEDRVSWDYRKGLVFTVSKQIIVQQQVNLKQGRVYLLKVEYQNLNNEGICTLAVNNNTKAFENKREGQCYLTFVASEKTDIIFTLTNVGGIVPMLYYLKNIMLVDLTKNNLEKIKEEDILRLPYIW